MNQCKYCKQKGEFEPLVRQVLCQKHKCLTIDKFLGRNGKPLTPEGVFREEYLH